MMRKGGSRLACAPAFAGVANMASTNKTSIGIFP
jgi:hypothetical protein